MCLVKPLSRDKGFGRYTTYLPLSPQGICRAKRADTLCIYQSPCPERGALPFFHGNSLNTHRDKHRSVGNVSETPTPTTSQKSTAVHLQFVRQYAPHLYRRTFLASKLRRKGNPAVRLPFVLQYASHLYGSTPPICTAVLLEKYWGLGSQERF